MDEIAKLEARIAELPRGSITKKVIQGKDRYYLQWREADKVKSRYVNLGELPQLSSQIELRKQLQQRIVELQVASIENSVSGGSFKMVAEAAAPYRCGNFVKKSSDGLLVDFFLGLERGYCLESRHRNILADGSAYVADAVFYNRFLRCHVIVSALNQEISKNDMERLESCVSYFRNYEMQVGDNLPMGILLCRCRGSKMVHFARNGIEGDIFTRLYKPKMPTKKELENFLHGKWA